MNPVSEWTEDYEEARRWANALKRTVKYVTALVTIETTKSFGRTYYRVVSNR